MILAVKDIEELVAVVLVSRDDVKDVFFDLKVRDTALERLLFCVESWFDSFSNFRWVDDLAIGLLSKDACHEGLASEGLAENDSPLSVVSQMFLESAFIPSSHSLETVLLLEEGVDGLHAHTVINDRD